jgi:hypothetical protein
MATKKKKRPVRKSVSKRKVAKPRKVKRVVKKRQPARKSVTKKASAKKKAAAAKALKKKVIGIVTHYFPKVRAAVVKLKVPLSVGDTVKIKGHTTDFIQAVNSMQIDHVPIDAAKKGDEIGLLVNSRVRGNDIVMKP